MPLACAATAAASGIAASHRGWTRPMRRMVEWHAMRDSLPVFRDELTPLAFLERTVRVFPDKTAVVYGGVRRTWAEFAEDVGRFAGALVRAGVGPGDRVAMLAPNVPALLAAHFAVLLVRGALVAINTRLNEAEVGY